jgi:tRNA dimethylallyltransferase
MYSAKPKNEPIKLSSEPNKKTLVIIAGPTAVGKTSLAVVLAQRFKTEIISADSRQFYQELNIGTAKPTAAEMQQIVHHFIDSHSINVLYGAGDFERDALALLAQLFQKHDIVIAVGGSGFYIKALCEGLDDLPTTPPELREKLMQRLKNEGLSVLINELQALDPVFCTHNDLSNSQRVVRSLEVCLVTGKPFSSFQIKKNVERPFKIIEIALDMPREQLYERIDTRMDQMLANGLVEEARELLPFKNHNALQTVGYKEVFDYFDELYNYEEMVRLLKRNSRRYAKRQLTWFKHQGNFRWFSANDFEAILRFIG